MTVCSKGRAMPGKTWRDSVVEGFAAATKKETLSLVPIPGVSSFLY